jgi:hypothetical protein
MIGRRAVVGLSLLSALLFCAFAAQSASAAKAVNTTMFTCVENGGKKDFADAHCDEKVAEGKFGHVAVANDVTTEIAATNAKVTETTKKSEPAVLKSKVGLTEVEISCNTVANEPQNSLAHNVETEGKHTLTGTVRTHFGNTEKKEPLDCTVKKPAKCTVKEPIVSNATFEAVEKLGKPAENEMGIELKGSGAEETFAEITFEGPECALKGKTFKVKGSVIGTSGPTTESSQTNHWSGATVVFTPKKEMQKLKLGAEPAEFETIVTQSMAGGGNPITATTCTATEAKC